MARHLSDSGRTCPMPFTFSTTRLRVTPKLRKAISGPERIVRKLQLRRLRFSKEADNWLRVLKARTGVTPNVLARMGYALSLEEPSVPDPSKFPEDSDREISRGTLL